MSVGVKGFRIGTGPRGNYVRMGHGGLYYRASLGGRSRQQQRQYLPSDVPTQQPSTDDGGVSIETGNVLDMEPSNGSAIVGQINQKLGQPRFWPWVLVSIHGVSVSAIILPRVAPLVIAEAICVLIGTVIAARWDQSRRCVVVMYDLGDDAVAKLKAFSDEFEKVASASRIWNVETSATTDD